MWCNIYNIYIREKQTENNNKPGSRIIQLPDHRQADGVTDAAIFFRS
ncbi:hypothetical protein CTB91_02042 [Dickeya solani]|uniref:Uncharacterized protein n=1 Tax=Dickeya solani D s0432-1 TaxID=1231725 RepID=A0AAV3KDD6_9GAMM|nr:hypothetical protein D083_0182 [Dickeya solani RNS 08.23.3.1.A]AYQ47849.1 hypothetical protein CTB91_02042 [Dickeya solani]ERO58833.1 hypothetical protein A544_2013 [Dickeya solani D s0432-1]AYQ52020.1 hypothetical protein DSOL99_02047 [Dickeya solani]NUA40022.1 hypothetical protein [Dickeya solani]